MDDSNFEGLSEGQQARMLALRDSEQSETWEAAVAALYYHGLASIDVDLPVIKEFFEIMNWTRVDLFRFSAKHATLASTLGPLDPWLRASMKCIELHARMALRFESHDEARPQESALALPDAARLVSELQGLDPGPDMTPSWVPSALVLADRSLVGAWVLDISSGQVTADDWEPTCRSWFGWAAPMMRRDRALEVDPHDTPASELPRMLEHWRGAEALVEGLGGATPPSRILSALMQPPGTVTPSGLPSAAGAQRTGSDLEPGPTRGAPGAARKTAEGAAAGGAGSAGAVATLDDALFNSMNDDIKTRLLEFKGTEKAEAWSAAAQAFCFQGYSALDFDTPEVTEFSRSVGKTESDFLRMASEAAIRAFDAGLLSPWLKASVKCIELQCALAMYVLLYRSAGLKEDAVVLPHAKKLIYELDEINGLEDERPTWLPQAFLPLSRDMASAWMLDITRGRASPDEWSGIIARWMVWSGMRFQADRCLGLPPTERPISRVPDVIAAWQGSEELVEDLRGTLAPSRSLATIIRLHQDKDQEATATNRLDAQAASGGVADQPAPTAAAEPTPKSRWALGFGLMTGLVAVGVLGAVVLGAAGWGAWQAQQAKERADESARLVASAWQMTKLYKTDPVQNKDDSVLAGALGEAQAAIDSDPSGEALGQYALLLVWTQHWHYAKATWDEAKFASASAATQRALSFPNPDPVASMARGLLAANACKLLPFGDGRRAALCEEAVTQFSAADALLAGDPRAWLRFELTWSEAAFFNRRALDARALGDNAGAETALRTTMSTCARGEQDLASSPVNDRELGEECTAAAGGLHDYAAYFKWARWLQDRGRRDDGVLGGRTIEMIYRDALPDCGDLTVQTHNKWRRSVPELGAKSRPSAYFCYCAGLLALGCADEAAEAAGFGRPLAPELPWDALSAAYVSDGSDCYLTRP